MNRRDAIDLTAVAIPGRRPQTWADFGAGEGTFTLALSDLLGAESRVFNGRIVVIEYDRRGPNRWVPYPIPLSKLSSLAAAAGLTEPNVIARRRPCTPESCTSR